MRKLKYNRGEKKNQCSKNELQPGGQIYNKISYIKNASPLPNHFFLFFAHSTLNTLAPPLRLPDFFFLFPLSKATALAWSRPKLSKSLTL